MSLVVTIAPGVESNDQDIAGQRTGMGLKQNDQHIGEERRRMEWGVGSALAKNGGSAVSGVISA